MRITELVHELRNKMQVYGDLEVVVQLQKEHDWNDDGPFGDPRKIEVCTDTDKVVIHA